VLAGGGRAAIDAGVGALPARVGAAATAWRLLVADAALPAVAADAASALGRLHVAGGGGPQPRHAGGGGRGGCGHRGGSGRSLILCARPAFYV